LAKEAIKPIKIDYTKRLGLIRQPQSGSILPVDGMSNFPVNMTMIMLIMENMPMIVMMIVRMQEKK